MNVLITMYNRTIKKRPYKMDLHTRMICLIAYLVQCILKNIPMGSRNIPRNTHTHLYYTKQIFMTIRFIHS